MFLRFCSCSGSGLNLSSVFSKVLLLLRLCFSGGYKVVVLLRFWVAIKVLFLEKDCLSLSLYLSLSLSASVSF